MPCINKKSGSQKTVEENKNLAIREDFKTNFRTETKSDEKEKYFWDRD